MRFLDPKEIIGTKVIVVSNDQDLMVGVMAEPWEYTNSKMPKVVDSSGKEWICGGIIIPFDQNLLNFLSSMDISKRWNFLADIKMFWLAEKEMLKPGKIESCETNFKWGPE